MMLQHDLDLWIAVYVNGLLCTLDHSTNLIIYLMIVLSSITPCTTIRAHAAVSIRDLAGTSMPRLLDVQS